VKYKAFQVQRDSHSPNVDELRRGVPCGRFLVKIAITPDELEAALRLRYRVFHDELNEGLAANQGTGLDRDEFDPVCDHLLLIFDGQVVGTYRLLYGPRRPAVGFYSQSEFDLCGLPLDWDHGVELGRGCVAPEFRKQSTLMTLFWGLNRYMRLRKARYLFGCASLPPMSSDDAEATFRRLLEMGRIDRDVDVQPHPSHAFEGDATKGHERIPPLLTLYLEFGARILGRPAYDAAFGCHDFFVVFDMDRLSHWGNELITRFDRRLGSV